MEAWALPALSEGRGTPGGGRSDRRTPQAVDPRVQAKLMKSPLFKSLSETKNATQAEGEEATPRTSSLLLHLIHRPCCHTAMAIVESIKAGARTNYGIAHGHVHGRADHACEGRLCLSCWSDPEKLVGVSGNGLRPLTLMAQQGLEELQVRKSSSLSSSSAVEPVVQLDSLSN